MTGAPWDDDAVVALGLDWREAAVLRAVCQTAGTSPADLAASSGLTRPQVSSAVRRLALLGLVEVQREQRPHLVTLAVDVEQPVRSLLEEADRHQEAARRAAAAGADVLRRQAALLRRAPRPPAQQPRRRGFGSVADHHLLVPRRSYAEVARLEGTTVCFGGPVRTGPAVRRLLVLGQPPPARRHWWEAHGVQVRTTSADLPALVLVDGRRAQVEVGASAASRYGWTSDAAQVAALGQLFDLWWEAASGS